MSSSWKYDAARFLRAFAYNDSGGDRNSPLILAIGMVYIMLRLLLSQEFLQFQKTANHINEKLDTCTDSTPRLVPRFKVARSSKVYLGDRIAKHLS